MTSLYSFVRRIIDIPSVTGQEGELSRFVASHLRESGFSVALQEVEPDRFNVFAHSDETPRIVFCTHLDTVPPFFPGREDERFIYGRGACDAKGILGAMLEAVVRLRAERMRAVGMLFVVGEELDSVGAKAANRFGVGSQYIIVGEPTENRLASGHKGTFKFVLRTEGRAAHSAYPHLGDSAIDRLLAAIEEIRRTDWGESPVLGKATVNIGLLSGGVAANVVAPRAEAHVYVRVAGRVGDVQAKLEKILNGDSHMSYEVISRSDAVLCHVLPGFDIAPVAFGTDIPSLGAFGKPLLVGPGSIHDAHTADEKVGKRDLEDAVHLYCRIARALNEGVGSW